MALRLGALYDALRLAPGIPEDAARQAAEEVAGYETRLSRIDADLIVLKWMVGIGITLTLLNLGLTFQLLTRVH